MHLIDHLHLLSRLWLLHVAKLVELLSEPAALEEVRVLSKSKGVYVIAVGDKVLVRLDLFPHIDDGFKQALFSVIWLGLPRREYFERRLGQHIILTLNLLRPALLLRRLLFTGLKLLLFHLLPQFPLALDLFLALGLLAVKGEEPLILRAILFEEHSANIITRHRDPTSKGILVLCGYAG